MASRLAAGKAANRSALHARAFIGGPSGSGKTRTSLIIAEVLAGDLADDPDHGVCFLDTEAEEALNYADDFTFHHVPWFPPYAPGELGETIMEAAPRFEVIVIDSASHFWQAEGGTLDIAGGRHTGWKEARPEQNYLVQCIKNAPAHILLCTRSKMEYVQELENGKHVVRKVGMGLKQDPEWEYEMNAGFELDMQHTITISKSRGTALEVGRNYRGSQAEEIAAIYAAFLEGGDPPAAQKVIEDLTARMNALPDRLRKEAKGQFKACLGPPARLGASQVEDAQKLVADWEAVAATPLETEEVADLLEAEQVEP